MPGILREPPPESPKRLNLPWLTQRAHPDQSDNVRPNSTARQ
jgi:hypothetical protein